MLSRHLIVPWQRRACSPEVLGMIPSVPESLWHKVKLNISERYSLLVASLRLIDRPAIYFEDLRLVQHPSCLPRLESLHSSLL